MHQTIILGKNHFPTSILLLHKILKRKYTFYRERISWFAMKQAGQTFLNSVKLNSEFGLDFGRICCPHLASVHYEVYPLFAKRFSCIYVKKYLILICLGYKSKSKSMPNTLHKLQETVDLVRFTEEILNGKLHSLSSDISFHRDGKILFSTLI